MSATPQAAAEEQPCCAGRNPGPGGADADRPRLSADRIPHLIWTTDPEGRITFVNRWAVEYTGWSPAETCAADVSWLHLLDPSEIDSAALRWEQATRAGANLALTCRIRRAHGLSRRHDVRHVPVLDGEGRIVEWVGTATDVEDREAQSDGLRRKQQQTDETEALLQTLQAASPVGLGLLDRDLGFLRVNEVLADITGATGTESETNFADLAPPAWQHVVDACRQTLATGEPVHGLTVTGGPDQAGTWLASCHPLPHHGTPTCVGLVLTDVTDYRRDAEFHTVILQNMSEGVYSTDAQGRLTSMNPAAMRMLGWAQCDILGQPAHELLHGRRADGSRCPADQSPILDVCRSGVPMTVSDAVLTCKDGSLLPVAYSVAPLRIGAAVTGVVTVFHDTTGLRRQQQRDVEARHDQKLESLGRLSAGLAHEINTPIQFVGDNTRFLAGAYQDMLGLLLVYRHCMNSGELPWQERKKLSDDAEAKADIEYLAAEVPAAIEQSLEGIDRVATLVRAMKSFSYKDSNNKAYADLNEAIRTTSIVARNEVKYVADLELDLGELPEVLCHVGDLNQVFLNLLVNAADAMEAREDRGRITVRTRAEEGWVVLSFADDGSGIPAENQKTIFEPFFTTKEVGKGTGQGLALARAVVCDKHDGTIELNSTLGEGSEFILRLPISGKANRAAA